MYILRNLLLEPVDLILLLQTMFVLLLEHETEPKLVIPVDVLSTSTGVCVLADVSRLVRRLRVVTAGVALHSVLAVAGVVELAVTEAGVVASGVELGVLVAGAGAVATLAGDTATG